MKKVVDEFLREHRSVVETALEQVRPGTDKLGDGELAELRVMLGIAVGRSGLQSFLTEKSVTSETSVTPETPDIENDDDPSVRSADVRHWNDLVLASACVCRIPGANERLMSLIHEHVLPALIRHCERSRAEEVSDQLAAKLHLISEGGLNRGRPKLLTYGGRSSLIAWLRSVALHQTFDVYRQKSRFVDDEAAIENAATSDDASSRSSTDDGSQYPTSEVIREAFVAVMRETKQSAPAQFKYGYLRCIQKMPPTEIAERMGVGKPFVTELSSKFCSKLLQRILDNERHLEIHADRTNLAARRKALEELLQLWLSDSEVASIEMEPTSESLKSKDPAKSAL